MSEVRSKAYLQRVKYVCDKCALGDMIVTGKVLEVYPPLYEHKCNHCGFMNSFLFTYPSIQAVENE